MKWLWRALGVLAAMLVGAFLVLRVPDTDPVAMRAKYGGPPSQFVRLATGPMVHLRDEGPRDAPVIVLLHGSNDDLHTWDPWVDRLAGRYRIIRYDQRGHGLTGAARDARYRTDAFSGDVEAVAKAMQLSRFVLVGSSMGGGIAVRYATLHPERLTGLVLVNAAGAPIERQGGGNLAFQILRLPVINQIGMSVMPRAVVAKSMRQSVADQSGVTDEMIDRIWELARYPGNRTATLTRFAQGYSRFSDSEVRGINVPALVMWGERDAIVPFAAARWYEARLPRGRLVSYPGVGHLPMQEAPGRSAADLEAFAAALRQPASKVSQSPS